MTKVKREIAELRVVRTDLKCALGTIEKLSSTATGAHVPGSVDVTILKDLAGALHKVDHEIALREA